MAYLYRHIRVDKNEVFYIGIGVGYRAWQKFHRNRHWKGIVNKTNYIVEIMMDGISWETAILKEIEFIKLYGRRDLGTGTLVNLTDGGEGMLGYIPSKETRDKISSKKKGINPRPIGWKMTDEGKRKMRVANKGKQKSLGRILSAETKNKISNSLKGNPPTNNKPIIMYTLKGAFVAEYESANEASKCNMYNVPSNITAVCRGRLASFMSFLWKYKSDCVDDEGNIIKKITGKEPLKRKPFKFTSEVSEWNYYRFSPQVK